MQFDFFQEEADMIPLKKRQAMLLPSKRVLLWETLENAKNEKQELPEIKIAFQFEYNESSHIISTLRKRNQDLTAEALPKITNLMKKKVFGNNPHTSENGLSLTINKNDDYPIPEKMDLAGFAADMNITSLLVNGEEFKIVRNGSPIDNVVLELTPIVGQYCMPKISYIDNGIETKFHWFVKKSLGTQYVDARARTKREVDSLEISFANERSRKFSLSGYDYKHTGMYYMPQEDDVGRHVAVVVDSGIDNPVNAAISSRPIKEAPEVITDYQVEWCKAKSENEKDKVVRVMSYNILADVYLKTKKSKDPEKLYFKYCPKEYQQLYYRTPIFLKQLHDFIDANVSIFFLQEVDTKRMKDYIYPFIKNLGFECDFAKKEKNISEGAAIIYNTNVFKLKSSSCSPAGVAGLADNDQSNEDILQILNGSKKSKKKFTSTPTIIQTVVLEHEKTGTILVCANTHLLHNPLDEHLKALQALVCVREVYRLQNKMRNENPGQNVRVLFGGDFNSTPDGPAFLLMNNGVLPRENNCWSNDKRIEPKDLTIEPAMVCLTGTPKYTNYTAESDDEGFVGCLDYIWGVGINIEERSVCPMPLHAKVIQHTALPSKNHPSDHLPVICDIKL